MTLYQHQFSENQLGLPSLGYPTLILLSWDRVAMIVAIAQFSSLLSTSLQNKQVGRVIFAGPTLRDI